jgi:hypothetical protein
LSPGAAGGPLRGCAFTGVKPTVRQTAATIATALRIAFISLSPIRPRIIEAVQES